GQSPMTAAGRSVGPVTRAEAGVWAMRHASAVTEQPSSGASRQAERAPLPTKALETSAENPWPVRVLSSKILDYIARMPTVWVEGQIVSLNAHNSSNTAWVTLRDTDVDMSMTVTLPKRMLT